MSSDEDIEKGTCVNHTVDVMKCLTKSSKLEAHVLSAQLYALYFMSLFLGIPSGKAWGKTKRVYYDADQQKEKDLGKFLIVGRCFLFNKASSSCQTVSK